MKADSDPGPALSTGRTIAVASFALILALAYGLVLSVFSHVKASSEPDSSLGPDYEIQAQTESTSQPLMIAQDPTVFDTKQEAYSEEQERVAAERQAKIDKVEAFFASYGAELQGYGHILVDQAEACGGDFRVLVGLAGSESGLGRVMYKKYNPFGYLDGVQYPNLEEALTTLSCKISQQHIAPCGTDLQCLAARYAGPADDKSEFIGNVRWFMEQVS